MLNTVPFEVLVLSNEPLKLHPVHLLSSFDVIAFRQMRFHLDVIHNFHIQLPVQILLKLAVELDFKVLISVIL